MSELIHQHSARVSSDDGTVYRAHILGRERSDGTWEGWIEFNPVGGQGVVLRTERETSQSDRDDLVYWAAGLEAIYLDGALRRAR